MQDLEQVAVERNLAGEHLVHGHAEAEQIGAMIDVGVRHLLGCGVRRRTDRGAGLGQASRVGIGVGVDRESEVEDPRVFAVAVPHDHDVVGLEVAMDEAELVRVGEPERTARGRCERSAPRTAGPSR